MPSEWQRETEAELIRRCLQNEDQAWAVLLDRYGGLIYSIALRSDLSPEDAADVFQSVCLTVLGQLEKLKDASKLSSWLMTITLRHCHRVKRRQRWNTVDLDQAEQELVSHSPLPDEVVQRLERERLVRQAVSMLNEPCRRLLTRLFLEKDPWSYDQIAKEMHLSPSTIGPKRERCLRKLEQILSELGFFD
jgi:RNA polymerase sigma factor (sigma-70 family)